MTNCPFCEIAHTVSVPTIHYNGTSAEELRSQIDGVVQAFRVLMTAMGHAAPNSRDHYLDRSEQRAIKEHCIREERLTEVLTEVCQIRDHIYEVMAFKDARKARG